MASIASSPKPIASSLANLKPKVGTAIQPWRALYNLGGAAAITDMRP